MMKKYFKGGETVMYTLLLKHPTRDNIVKIEGFRTQEEAYKFYCTYFDEGYSLEILKEICCYPGGLL